MPTITAQARAKINLWLTVGDRRPDGYHDIETVMQQVSLCDLVSVTRQPDHGGERTIQVHCSDPGVPADRRNIVWKCAEAFFEACGIESYCIRIDIEKHIPQAAGLAGGSADGAATLKLLNLLFGIRASLEFLRSVGAKVGADIPFCLAGGLALCRGKGEILTPVKVPPTAAICSCAALIVKSPALSVSTGEAYRLLDENPPSPADAVFRQTGLDALLAELRKGRIPRTLYNDFERVAPEGVARIKERIRSLGALSVLMSGSGPSVYGLFEHFRDAEAARDALVSEGFGAWAVRLC
jgi:4-diphosphocytidyl-2-C-methyl-D-erythritol kinase